MSNIPLVLLLGLLSTTQLHLAKALQRQGIEVFEQIRARVTGGAPVRDAARKPLIYSVGLVLNYTVFVYSVLAQPFGPPALFTSMYGMGLVVLMLYAAAVLREPVTRREAAGAAAIVAGTLLIGLENVMRGDVDRSAMQLEAMLAALAGWTAAGTALLAVALRRRQARLTGAAFGFFAGGLGGLDPFLKGVAQNLGGTPRFVPDAPLALAIFAASFLIGFLAFVVTQIGFARKARASVLVPAYTATFIGLPVFLQLFLLPGYWPYAPAVAGIGLIAGGIALMYAFGRQEAAP